VKVRIVEDSFDPWTVLAEYEAEHSAAGGNIGATATFVGTMRDFNEGVAVNSMTLEYYPGMTEKHLQQIGAAIAQLHSLVDWLIVHRVGRMQPGEPIVLVAAWSAHRVEAFAACREIMEDLKAHAPFWKKEQLTDGERWVEHNTPG